MRALVLLLIVLATGCQSEPDDSAAPTQQGAPITRSNEPSAHTWAPPEVIAGWASKGKLGHIAFLSEGPLGQPMFEEGAPEPGELPAFAIEGPLFFDVVKDPGVPFGLQWYNPVNGQLGTLAHLENLQLLKLVNGEDLSVADLEQLAELKNLTSLIIYVVGDEPEPIDAGMAHLATLSGLERLQLAGLNVDAGLEHLAELEHLTSLSLHASKVTDAGLEHVGQLRNLQGLDVGHTAVTDAGLAHLSGLSRLRILKLWEAQVTPEGVERLRAQLPDCRIVEEFDPY